MLLPPRSAGVLLHITSLPGPHGMGDFGPGAHRFVDWLADAGQHIWQWLPTTPIGPGNSPYQSVSAFAGSPMMVALEPLVEQGWLPAPALPPGGFDAQRVDFARAVPWRLAQLRAAFAGFEAGATNQQRAALDDWAQSSSRSSSGSPSLSSLPSPSQSPTNWLPDYSLFMALENAHHGQPWWTWPQPLRQRNATALAQARQHHHAEMAFWCFVQWCFDTQCAALKAYANQRGVALMGDLPIFVAHHSADVWARQDLYCLDDQGQPSVVAGVPPDQMGPQGQRWGNPLYRWDRMQDEGFAWWIARVQQALSQTDIFRIDHFRGFAAYFEIPASSPTAQIGRWVPGPGKPLFDAIEQAVGPLPIVAEDLGLITPDVLALRDACGFPGMKILQFAFGGDASHPYLPHNCSVPFAVYSGTHDNDTARGWWDAAPEHERRFAGSYLACGAHDVHWALIRAAANSVAAMAICPLQDVLGLDSRHRMNTPGTMGESNWSWRFTWDMLGSEPGRVLGLITAASGRGPFVVLAA